MIRALIVLVLAWALPVAPRAHAQTITEIDTEGAVTAIIETPRGTYAETERGTLRLSRGDCAGGICATPDVIRGDRKSVV